jgi:hypothetical protein
MAKFRKKPVVVDAVQWNGANHLITETFMKGSGSFMSYERKQLGEIIIPTPEGNKPASAGDWIIKGVNGEFYSCKPDIFEKDYVLVNAKNSEPKVD